MRKACLLTLISIKEEDGKKESRFVVRLSKGRSDGKVPKEELGLSKNKG